MFGAVPPELALVIILGVSVWAVVWPVRWFLGRRKTGRLPDVWTA